MANTMRWLTALNLLGLVCLTAPVQAAALALEQELTGGSSRAWFEGSALPPGPTHASCDTPDSFTFETTHHLTIDRCIGGRWTSSRHAWRLEGAAPRTQLHISTLGLYVIIGERGAPGANNRRLSLHPAGDAPGRQSIELEAFEN